MKKYVAEFIGTLVLVFMGCGTAMLVGYDSDYGSSYILTALAFGLTISGMTYCFVNVSGCHINPAVSLAMCIRGDISFAQFILYTVSQFCGSIIGTVLLAIIFKLGDITDMTSMYAANGLNGVNGSIIAGFIIESLLTFIFVFIVLSVSSERKTPGHLIGLIIGLAFSLVYILGIKLTGGGVNPARSLGPAFFAGREGIAPLWIFIIGPFAGAALAGLVFKCFDNNNDDE